MADGDHDAALVVADGAPLGLIAVLLVGAAGPNLLLAGNLHLVVDVVESMKDLVAALQVFDGAIGQHLAHAVHKVLPVLSAVKVVHHQEAALEQIFAQALGLVVGEGPGLHLHSVDPGIVEDFVGVERDDLLGGAAIDARQPVHGDEKLAVGLGIIARPGIAPQ